MRQGVGSGSGAHGYSVGRHDPTVRRGLPDAGPRRREGAGGGGGNGTGKAVGGVGRAVPVSSGRARLTAAGPGAKVTPVMADNRSIYLIRVRLGAPQAPLGMVADGERTAFTTH